jgi:GT2 family glycosyltransferase
MTSRSAAFASPPAPVVSARTGSVPLSVVIVTYRRVEALSSCLASVLGASLPPDAEVVVLCNGPDDATRRRLDAFARDDARLTILETEAVSLAAARNAALVRAAGEIIYFLDDDVTVVPDLFSSVLATFRARPEVAVIGGPNLTPPDSSAFEQCVGAVLASPFGAATVRHRYIRGGAARASDDRSLMGCNLAMRRAAIAAMPAPFREHLVCSDETVLLGKLAAGGAQMLHHPDLVVYHRRRASLSGFCAQVFRYGRGRWQRTLLAPASLRLQFAIPAAFVVYLLSLFFIRAPIYRLPLLIYLMLVLTVAAFEAWRSRRPMAFARLLALFPACHLSYGGGFLFEMVRSLQMLAGRRSVVGSAAQEGPPHG